MLFDIFGIVYVHRFVILIFFCRMAARLNSAYHIECSIANRLGLVEYPCACTWCRGSQVKKVNVVANHHSKNGRDPYLMYPVMVSDSSEWHIASIIDVFSSSHLLHRNVSTLLRKLCFSFSRQCILKIKVSHVKFRWLSSTLYNIISNLVGASVFFSCCTSFVCT